MANQVKPVSPDEVTKRKAETLPAEVIEAFNELIVQKCANGHGTIKQGDAVALILSKMADREITRADIFKNGWLDVEKVYRAAGWDVVYDKPGYNESYEPTFEFTRRRKE